MPRFVTMEEGLRQQAQREATDECLRLLAGRDRRIRELEAIADAARAIEECGYTPATRAALLEALRQEGT